MKVGTICYATSRGLGHLAHDFYLHNIITDAFVVEHGRVPTNWNWYPNAPNAKLKNFSVDCDSAKKFCQQMGAMLFFETPFNWKIVDYCKGINVPTYLVTMYECTPRAHTKPTKYLCPSLLDMEYFPLDSEFLSLPVEYPWRLRERAEHFVHNGGYLGLRGREGTTLLIEAIQYVKSPIRLTIRVQENVSVNHQRMIARDKRVEYIAGSVPYSELYHTGDVSIVPQKFNGCSLPLQEACAAGMLMMTTNRFPMNTWLRNEPLIPVEGYIHGVSIGGPYLTFDEAIVDPNTIAKTIDEWYGKDITEYSLYGRQWAEKNSWEVLGPKWKSVLESK